MRGWGTLTAVVIGLALIAAMGAWAQDQQQPSSMGEQRMGWQPNNDPYFQATRMPYQSSFTRMWQDKLEDMWGGVTAGRGVPPPHWGPVFLPPSAHCVSSGYCYRRWQFERGYPGNTPPGWYGWYPPIY